MRVLIQLTGTTPLLMHNEQLSDPLCEFAKQIKAITDKKKNQTEHDKELVSKIEWRGGLYDCGNGTVGIPTRNMARCWKEAGKVTRAGTKITRGITPLGLFVPLLVGGKEIAIDKIVDDKVYYDRRQVGISKSRISRTRPIFAGWMARAQFEVIDDILNFEEFVSIVDLGGRAIGLGDARILGYGRYTSRVSRVSE